jgi:hypothetical protein
MDAPMNIPCLLLMDCCRVPSSFSISHLIIIPPIETRQSVDGAGDKQSIGGEAKITADKHTNKGAKAWHNFHA